MIRNIHVIIIGAGTTGLLAAQGLKKAGISCTVYERIDETTYQNRQRNWSMSLTWGSIFVQKVLPQELLSQLHLCEPCPHVKLSSEDETTFPMINGKTGEEVASIKAHSTRRVSREKARKLFSEGVDIRFGKKIIDLEDLKDDAKVKVLFEDGTSAVADLVLGADSTKSVLRRKLVPDGKGETEIMNITPYNFTTRYTADQAQYIRSEGHPLFKAAPHPEQNTFFMLAPMDITNEDDPSSWVFQLVLSLWGQPVDKTTPAQRLAEVKRLGANYCEPFRSATRWIPDDTVIADDRFSQWANPVEWNNLSGKVTLAGDAAHPMSPYRGQGFNMGLEDAARYVEAVKQALVEEGKKGWTRALKEAIDDYDRDVLSRARVEIDMSGQQAYMSHHWDMFANSAIVKIGTTRSSKEK